MNPDPDVSPSSAPTHAICFLKSQKINNFFTLIKNINYQHLQGISLIGWDKSGWISIDAEYLPRFLCSTTPAITMALHAQPTIPSDLTTNQAFESNTGILHASLLGDPTLTVQYQITTRSILPTFTQDRNESGYDVFSFTPFSSEAAWTRLHPEQAILNTIYIRLRDTNPPTFMSQASSMSTYPAPTTTYAHISLSNQTVEPTMALISLM